MLLASTGLRISEAIALRVIDARIDFEPPHIHVRRAIVDGQLTSPKSRHGRRTIPMDLTIFFVDGLPCTGDRRPKAFPRRSACLIMPWPSIQFRSRAEHYSREH